MDGTVCRMCHSSQLEPMPPIEGHRFLRCTRCAFIFTPDLVQRQADERYERFFEGTPETGWASIDFLRPALDRLSGRRLRCLDFGTGESDVPELLRQAGHDCLGVDLVPPLEPRPDRLTGNLLELDLPADGFDLVFSFQVFEHLAEPRPIFDELMWLTRPGGLMMVHTDMETPERERDGFTDWWYVIPPDHCSFYRPKTFAYLCQSLPHRVVDSGPKYVIVEKRPRRTRHAPAPVDPTPLGEQTSAGAGE